MSASRGFAPPVLGGYVLGIFCLGGSLACVAPENPCDSQAEPTLRQTASLSGIVLDQDERPVAGVTVLVNEASKTTVSAEDGTFTIVDLLPNDGDEGYEVSAVPMPPLLGGVVRAEPVGCRAEVTDIELRVARPPAAPATDWVQATSDERLLVGFPSVVDSEGGAQADAYRYQVELRVPFGTWKKALLTCDSEAAQRPWAEIEADVTAYEHTITDSCAQHLCLAYVDAAPILDAGSARCAQVVGIEDADSASGYSRLHRNGSYLVRVVSERSSNMNITDQRLPAVLSSAEINSITDVTLIPTSWAEVPLAADPDTHNERSAELAVECIFGFSEGRFAMLDPSSGQGGVRMLSSAASATAFAQHEEVAGDVLVHSEEDTLSVDDELGGDSGTPLAILSHGTTMRVLKRLHDGGGLKIEKIPLGDASALTEASLSPASFHWDFSRVQFRGFQWLDAYDTTESGNPPDAYILYFKRGFLLVERESTWHEEGASLAGNFDRLTRFANYLGTSVADLNAPGFSAGFCSDMQEPGGQSVDEEESDEPVRVTRVCVNMTRLTGDSVDLQSLAVLSAAEDETETHQTVHLFSDAAKDRILAFPSDAFLGQGTASLKETMHEVPVGRSPGKMQKSRILSCGEDGDAAKPVLLVANEDSQDISVLSLTDSMTRSVAEMDRIPLPAPPVDFLMDEAGPDCASPFSWVILSDGRVVPIDMRQGVLELPSCGDAPCAIEIAGKRVRTGAINRDENGQPRMIFGGTQVLGEIGFLRPGQRRHYGQ